MKTCLKTLLDERKQLMMEFDAKAKLSDDSPDYELPPIDLLIESEPMQLDEQEKEVRRKAKILENFLYGENQLHPDETRALYVDFRNRHKDLKPGSEEFKKAILEAASYAATIQNGPITAICVGAPSTNEAEKLAQYGVEKLIHSLAHLVWTS